MDGVGVMEWAGYKWSGAWMAGHGLKIKPRDHTVGTTGQWIISSVCFPLMCLCLANHRGWSAGRESSWELYHHYFTPSYC